jgi:rhodanese-related sulfurtransferase
MTNSFLKKNLPAGLLIVIIFCVPLFIYYISIGKADSVSFGEAQQLLSGKDTSNILVDIRTESEFRLRHISASVNLPFPRIERIKDSAGLAPEYRKRKLLLICNSGIQSAIAAIQLKKSGIKHVYSIKGGIQRWRVSSEKPGLMKFSCYVDDKGKNEPFPFIKSSITDQYLMVFTGFIIKPVYMLISLLIFLMLLKRKEPDLKALRWAMLFFFIGEAFCSVNYLIFDDDSYMSEYIHSAGMVFCFGFVAYALMEFADERIIHFSDLFKKCSFRDLCPDCNKSKPFTCRLRKVFYLLISAVILLSFIPLQADIHAISYKTEILGTLYNNIHPTLHQIYEIRILPFFAIILSLASLLILILNRDNSLASAKIIFSASLGAWCFSFFRLVLFNVFADNLNGFAIWEEITEFIFIIAVLFILILWKVAPFFPLKKVNQ